MRVSALALIIPTAVLAVAIDKDSVNQEQEIEGVVGYFKNIWLSKRNILYRYHNPDTWEENHHHHSWREHHNDWNDDEEPDYYNDVPNDEDFYANERSFPVEKPVDIPSYASPNPPPSDPTPPSNSFHGPPPNALAGPPPNAPPSQPPQAKPVAIAKAPEPVSYSVSYENGNYVYRPVYSQEPAVTVSESYTAPDFALFPTDSPFAAALGGI